MSANYFSKLFDNVGWVRGTRFVNGGWSAYLWVIQNKITFLSSTTDWWRVSTTGAPVVISKVLVGSLGDYDPATTNEDIGPKIPTNFLGTNASEVREFQADYTNVFYRIVVPLSITPRSAYACVGGSNVQYTVTGTNIPNGVRWEISPTNFAGHSEFEVTSDFYASVIPGTVATNYKIRATSKDNTNFSDEVDLTVVSLRSPLQYKIGTNTWADMRDPLYVCQDTAVDFKAIKVPTNASWPSGKPVWGGLVSGSGMETNSYTFSTISTSATDYKLVIAECGNIVTGRVIVPDVVVTNIKFNHDTNSSASDAINIRKDYNRFYDNSNGEWVKGVRNNPVCYTINKAVTIKARLITTPAINMSADIWAVSTDSGGSLGDVVKTNVVFSGGISSPEYVTFQISGTTPDNIQKTTNDVWAWKMENVNGSGSAVCNLNTSRTHKVYTILAEPASPWDNTPRSKKNAWTTVLDYSCKWAAGQNSEYNAVAKITTGAYTGFGKTYEGRRSRTEDNNSICHLTELIATNTADCRDMSAVVQLFTRILGGATVQVRRVNDWQVDAPFKCKPILLIGLSTWNTNATWTFHQFGWHADSVNDACVKLQDKESTPYVPVHDDLNGNYKTNLYDNIGAWNPLPPVTIPDFD